MVAALWAFLHHAAAFVVFAALTVELMLLRGEVNVDTARSVRRMDVAYGIAAGVLILAGIVRVHFMEKGAAYYLHSAPFLLKMTLFMAVGVLSIQPTREFRGWRAALREQCAPVVDDARRRRIRLLIHIELALLLLAMLCAALMARGVGYFG